VKDKEEIQIGMESTTLGDPEIENRQNISCVWDIEGSLTHVSVNNW